MADILTNLAVNQQDDMEITSEAGQADVDFDIDFEPNTRFSVFQNEDAMQDATPIAYEQEDIELRSATDNNDYMTDDITFDRLPDQQDGLMLDDPPLSTVDEELLDLSEDDGLPESHDTAPQHTTDAFEFFHGEQRLDTGYQDWTEHQLDLQPEAALDSTAQAEPQLASAEQTNTSTDTSHETHENPLATEIANGESVLSEHKDGQRTVDFDNSTSGSQEKEQGAPSESHTIDTADSHLVSGDAAQQEIQESAPEATDFETNTLETHDQTEHPAAESGSPRSEHSEDRPTLTGLHPTVVKYDGGIYTLFPSSEPSEGEEYFLRDENLVNSSIGDLLQACRAVLGDAITEDFELGLQVDDLELFVGEDSAAAFSTSFAELLDLFVQLHQNDGIEHPPPMTVSLITKSRFANRLTLLSNAAAKGSGISQFPSVYRSHDGGENGTYSYEEQEATEYLDVEESFGADGVSETATDVQQTGARSDKSGADTGSGLDVRDAGNVGESDVTRSHDTLTELDYPDPLDDGSSHTVSRDEPGETYLQDDASQTDQLYNLTGNFEAEEADGDDINYDEVGDAVEDGEESIFDEVRPSAVETVADTEPNTEGAHDSGLHSHTEPDVSIVSAGIAESQSKSEVLPNQAESADSSRLPQNRHDKPEAPIVVDEDEIDFGDELDGGDTQDDITNISVGRSVSTPRSNAKRGLDEVLHEEDPDAKRHRLL